MKIKNAIKPYISFFIVFAILAIPVFIQSLSTRDAKVIRIHDDQIDIQRLVNSITSYILINGYDYRVELVESTIKEVQDRLVSGDIDVTLEFWRENNLTWFSQAIEDKSIIDLGTIYLKGRQYWIIPKWYAKEKNIKSVFDLKAHWRDFANPEDPSKGIFFNCIFGWSCQDINRVKLQAYGLDRYFNTVSPTSPEALESIYHNARKHNLPVFGYYWEPNALIAGHEWYPLNEPAYDPDIWEQIIHAASDAKAPLPDKACAYQESAVHKIANAKFLGRAHDAAQMLAKMEFTPQVFDDVFFSDSVRKTDPKNFEQLAIEFFKKHPDIWQGWVTEKAAKKIVMKLKNEG